MGRGRRCGEEGDRRWRRWIRLGKGPWRGKGDECRRGDGQRWRRSDSPEMGMEVERGRWRG